MILGAAPKSSPILRLQLALQAFSRAVNDPGIATVADGRMGARTAAAVNRAMAMVADAPAELRTGQLTQARVAAQAGFIASYLMAATAARSRVAPQAAPPPAAPAPQRQMQDDATYAPYGPPSYAPAPYMPRGPAGLPADRASFDVRAFIPAQYEHLRIHPGLGMAIVVVGVVAVLMASKHKKPVAKGAK